MESKLQLQPTVQVQIVTFNSSGHIGLCLAAIGNQTYPIERILVIDNDSKDDSVKVVKQSKVAVDLIRLTENTGYAAAHNLGFEMAFSARTDYVVTINPDVFVTPEYVYRLVSACASNGSYGGATGKLLRRQEDSVDGTVIDSTGLQVEGFFHVRDRGSGQIDRYRYEQEEIVWGVCGAAALYRVKMLKDLMLRQQVFDESFFAYKEDVDLCWRANRRGWRFVYDPSGKAYHVRGWKTHSKTTVLALTHSFVNQIALLVAHVPKFSLPLLSSILIETGRLSLIATRAPMVAFHILNLLRQNWRLMWDKRRELKVLDIPVERRAEL